MAVFALFSFFSVPESLLLTPILFVLSDKSLTSRRDFPDGMAVKGTLLSSVTFCID